LAILKCVVLLCRDGQLKRVKAKKEWKEKQQEEFSKRLKVEWESPVPNSKVQQ
jgi:hypothetical protein